MTSLVLRQFDDSQYLEDIAIRKKVLNFNKNQIRKQKMPEKPNFYNFKLDFRIQPIAFLYNKIEQSVRVLPKAPNIPKLVKDPANTYKFRFYHGRFDFIYFMVTSNKIKDKTCSQIFKNVYKRFIPERYQPICNFQVLQNEVYLERMLRGLLDSNIEMRLIVSVEKDKELEKISKIILSLPKIEEKNLKTIIIGDNRGLNNIIKKSNSKIVDLQAYMKDQFKRQVERSVKVGHVLYFNFVNTNISSSEVYMRKKLMQKCLEPKSNEQYRKILSQLIQYTKTYQNKNLLNDITKLVENNKVLKSEKLNAEVKKRKDRIKQMQEEESKLYSSLLAKLVDEQPIQDRQDYDEILFTLINQYKKEHSFYQLINNNLRKSMSVDEKVMYLLTFIIKYLFEAIKEYFYIYRGNFKITKLFRGFRMSLMQSQKLKQGDIIRNLGFLSTSHKKEIAERFRPTKDTGGYLMIIQVPEYFQYSDEDQQGFIDMQTINREKKHYLKNSQFQFQEAEVLFNPLNIFEVQKIDREKGQIYLIYAPHLDKNKMDEERYSELRSQIKILNKKNYQRGRYLHMEGKITEALQHYESIEANGETLSMQEKLNQIEILKETKDVLALQKTIDTIIDNCQNIIQQLENQAKQQQAFDKIAKLRSISKQSGAFDNSLNRLLEFEQITENISEKTEIVSKEVMESQSQISIKELLQFLTHETKTKVDLAKSKKQTNQSHESIVNSFVAFQAIDEIYMFEESNILPKIQEQVRSMQVLQENPNEQGLVILREIRDINMGKSKIKQEKKFKYKKELQTILKRLNKTEEKMKKEDSKQIEKELSKYFEERVRFKQTQYKYLFTHFYNALTEVSRVTSLIKQRGVRKSAKKAISLTRNEAMVQTSLAELKQFIDTIKEYEKECYDILKDNMKACNMNIKLVMEDEMLNYYERFSQSIIKKQQVSNINVETVEQKCRYAQFLSQKAIVESNPKLKEEGQNILQQLLVQLENQSGKKDSSTLVTSFTLVIEADVDIKKSSFCENQIIQSSLMKQMSKEGSGLKCVSSYRTRQDFNQLQSKLQQLQRLHRSDKQINNFYFLLKDVRDKVEVLNSSFSISQSTAQYQQFLLKANRSIEDFERDYISKQKDYMDECIIQLFYLKAENELKRGNYKRAKRILEESCIEKLREVFDRQIKKIKRDKRESQNKLYVRDLPIKIMKLKAQIIGTYESQESRIRIIDQLIMQIQRIQKVAKDKVISRALANQSLIYVLSRIIPTKIKFKWQKDFTNALDTVIRLRKRLHGDENQFLARAYSDYMLIDKSERRYNQGKRIFKNLDIKIRDDCEATHMDKQPMLYYYRNQLEYQFNRKSSNNKSKSEIFRKNLSRFTKINYSSQAPSVSLDIWRWYIEGGNCMIASEQYQQADSYYSQSKKQQRQLQKLNRLKDSNPFIFKEIEERKLNIASKLLTYYEKTKNTEKLAQFKNQIKQISPIVPKPPPPPPPKEQKQQDFLDYLLRIILGQQKGQAYRQ